MHVEVRQTKDVVILDLKGRLTAGLGDQILREAIDELLAEGRRRILLNLSEVAFLDSAGVGELVAGLKTARRFGAELKDVREKVRSDLVEEAAYQQARTAAAGVKAKAETMGLERAAAAASLVRKETPALVGRGQALGDLGSGAALEEAAFSLPEKTTSDPVRTASGWAVLRVLEKKPFDAAEFAKQKGQVAASLRQQRQSELFRAFVVAARERYEIARDAKAYRRALGQEQ